MRAGQTNFGRPALGLERRHVVDGDNMSKPLSRQFYLKQALFRKSEIVFVVYSGLPPPLYTQKYYGSMEERSFNVDYKRKLHLFGV
jgi:hypothetical protein